MTVAKRTNISWLNTNAEKFRKLSQLLLSEMGFVNFEKSPQLDMNKEFIAYSNSEIGSLRYLVLSHYTLENTIEKEDFQTSLLKGLSMGFDYLLIITSANIQGNCLHFIESFNNNAHNLRIAFIAENELFDHITRYYKKTNQFFTNIGGGSAYDMNIENFLEHLNNIWRDYGQNEELSIKKSCNLYNTLVEENPALVNAPLLNKMYVKYENFVTYQEGGFSKIVTRAKTLNLSKKVINTQGIHIYSALPFTEKMASIKVSGDNGQMLTKTNVFAKNENFLHLIVHLDRGYEQGEVFTTTFEYRIPRKEPLLGKRLWSVKTARFVAELGVNVTVPQRFMITSPEVSMTIDNFKQRLDIDFDHSDKEISYYTKNQKPKISYAFEFVCDTNIQISLSNISQIKILFLASNPTSTAKLNLNEEFRIVHKELRKNKNKFDLEQEWAVTPDTLDEAIQNYEPHIVHFTGHGEETDHELVELSKQLGHTIHSGGIILSNSKGESQLVPTDALANMFSVFSNLIDIKIVLLSACYSHEQAERIGEFIPYVIGMDNEVSVESATTFAKAFYFTLIKQNYNVELACKIAANRIALWGGKDYEVVTLYKNGIKTILK